MDSGWKPVGSVREEDTDWAIYHHITGEKGCSLDTIIKKTGYPPEVVSSSLDRLSRYCLVECRDDVWCACHLQQIIVKNQMKCLLTDGLELSGGVIRYRPSGEGTK